MNLVKRAIEVAHQLDAQAVKFWPGQDGFDYPFQVDYRQLWDYSIEGVRAVAETDPGMQFAIEYKEKEREGKNAARTGEFGSAFEPAGGVWGHSEAPWWQDADYRHTGDTAFRRAAHQPQPTQRNRARPLYLEQGSLSSRAF